MAIFRHWEETVDPQQPQQYPDPQPPKPRWSRRKRWRVIGAIVAAFLIIGTINALLSGCEGIGNTATDTTPTQAAQSKPTAHPTQPPPLAENLTFSGDVSGVLTAGDEPHPITHDNPLPAYVQRNGTYFDPAPTWTQCADFDSGIDYVAVIVGKVGTMRYAVTVEINKDNPAYTKPGTELRPGNINSGGGVHVYEMGGKNRRWQQVYGPAQQDTVIVLHADRVSGTVNAWLATTDQSQKIASSTLQLQGDWRCG